MRLTKVVRRITTLAGLDFVMKLLILKSQSWSGTGLLGCEEGESYGTVYLLK